MRRAIRAAVLLLLPATLALATEREEAAAPVKVAFKVECDEPCAAVGTLLLRSSTAETRAVPLAGGTAATALAPGTTWDVELRADGLWMPAQPVTIREGSIALRAWPVARLRGRVSTPKDESDATPRPETLRIELDSPPAARGTRIPRGSTIDCAIAGDGAWTCEVPAAAIDLVLRVKGFVPHYLWDVVLAPGAVRDLGALPLRRGGSFVAWLDGASARALGKSVATARLSRAVVQEPSALAQRLTRPVAEATFNSRGVAQLAPLPAGTYVLHVTAPGFAAVTVEPVEIFDNKESSLRRTIALDPPLTIRLTLDPARGPSGARWTLNLYRMGGLTGGNPRVASGQADDAGVFEAPDQSAGRYRVAVEDGHGNIFARTDLEIHGPADAQRTIALSLLGATGRVTLGGRPVAASLLFGGNGGTEQIRTKADAEGVFSVSLPRAGQWRVDIHDATAQISTAVVVNVSVDGELSIDLPDTEISGRVEQDDGMPVTRAGVLLTTPAGILEKRAKPDGTFTFRGVTGSVHLDARNMATGERSSSLAVDLRHQSKVADLVLVIDATRDVRGVVTSQGAPVVGARVAAYGFVHNSAWQTSAVSGLQGEFSVPINGKSSRVTLIVAAAGRTLQVYDVTGMANPLHLELAPVGGTVQFRGPIGRVDYNGVNVPFSDLLQWAMAQGSMPADDVYTIPNLAPGAYRLCARTAEGEKCREGTLARGASLQIAVDGSP